MKRNHGYFILWGKLDGIAFFVGQPEERARIFALLRLPGPRRRSDPTLAASSGGAVLIGDEGPFSVLNSGRSSDHTHCYVGCGEQLLCALHYYGKEPCPDKWKGYRSRV